MYSEEGNQKNGNIRGKERADAQGIQEEERGFLVVEVDICDAKEDCFREIRKKTYG